MKRPITYTSHICSSFIYTKVVEICVAFGAIIKAVHIKAVQGYSSNQIITDLDVNKTKYIRRFIFDKIISLHLKWSGQ